MPDVSVYKTLWKSSTKDFEGKCYVFDNRVAVDVNSENPVVISTCFNCGTITAKMINCANPECNEHFTQCDACGDALQGCCCETCMEHPRKRAYDGTGYYVKVPQPVNSSKKSLKTVAND